jgi:hypothetical protein
MSMSLYVHDLIYLILFPLYIISFRLSNSVLLTGTTKFLSTSMIIEDNSSVRRHPEYPDGCVSVSDVHTASISYIYLRKNISPKSLFIFTHIADDSYVSSLIPTLKPQISLRLI